MLTHLGDMPIETFLKDYWQKKPLLIRQAFADFESPLAADELAGLALEESVESRIIIEQRRPHQRSNWALKCGPFSDKDFTELPKSHWTLLIQAVDQYVPEISALLDEFRFIPNWRLDDVMVSYAPDGGSVGPHFDYYDVFLLQAHGQRRWQTGQTCSAQSPRLDGTPLSILKTFDSGDDWVLEPGDMLYLPPQLAHWGIAQGDDCMTYSFGFRAPSHADILGELAHDIGSSLSNDQRYTDAGIRLQDNPGEISADAIEQIQSIIKQHLQDPSAIAAWLGRYMTESKYSESDEEDTEQNNWHSDDWLVNIACGAVIERNLGARFVYYQADKSDLGIQLYVDGQSYDCDLALAEKLCLQTKFFEEDLSDLNAEQLALISNLLNRGSLCIEDDD